MNPAETTRPFALGRRGRPSRTVAFREPVRYRAMTRDGVELSLLRYCGNSKYDTPVLLTHGTLSNAQVCVRLAAFLSDNGFDCWIVEWRGHGESEPGTARPDFGYLAEFDVAAGLEQVRRLTGKSQVFLIGHSGGGLVFLMHLARRPESRAHVRGVVTLAAQATQAGVTWRDKAKFAGILVLNNVLGYVPGPMLGLGPEKEGRGVMNEWFRWNLTRRWRARDGFDYTKALREVDIPLLCLAGAGDRFVAPVRGCLRVFEAVGSRDKQFVLCGRESGFGEDYDHARIIASRGASREIWPAIGSWLDARAEPVQAPR